MLVDEAFGGRPRSDGRAACRLLALANVLDSMSRGRAACQAGLQRQTLRSIRSGRRAPDPVSLIEGVIRFNAEAWRGCAIGPRAAGRRGLMRASWRRSWR